MTDRCSECGKFMSWDDPDAQNDSYDYYDWWSETVEEEDVFICGKCSRRNTLQEGK